MCLAMNANVKLLSKRVIQHVLANNPPAILPQAYRFARGAHVGRMWDAWEAHGEWTWDKASARQGWVSRHCFTDAGY